MSRAALRALVRRPAAGMAAATAASRITGLLRTVALAAALGVGTTSDAYNIANTAPNMLFALIAGGVLGSALVPMLVRAEAEAEPTTASVVLGTVTLWTTVGALVCGLAAPWLIQLLTGGAGGRADVERLLALGTSWLRWFAPQIALYGISVVATAIMTARGRLALGAAAPVATNVLIIAAAAIAAALASRGWDVDSTPVRVLGAGTTLAVGAMAGIQLWGARRLVPGLRFSPRLRHAAVVELRGLAGWMVLYVVVNQVALGAVIALASRAPGAVTAYQWSFMLMQLPYAIVAVSIFSATYPRLAKLAGRTTDLTPEVTGPAMRAAMFLIPSVAGLIALASPLAAIVVGEDGSRLVAAGITGFAISLLPFSIFQLLARAHYVRSDTRTPALVNIAVNGAMLVVDLLVVGLVDDPSSLVRGLAIGHATSYVVGCLLLGLHLVRRGALRPAAADLRVLGRPVAAALLMTAVLIALPDGTGSGGRFMLVLRLAAVAALGAGTYLATAGAAVRNQLVPAARSDRGAG